MLLAGCTDRTSDHHRNSCLQISLTGPHQTLNVQRTNQARHLHSSCDKPNKTGARPPEALPVTKASNSIFCCALSQRFSSASFPLLLKLHAGAACHHDWL
jgi:hypothetical protein